MLGRKFEEQVKQFPEKLAVQTRERSLTYDELNQSANRVARTIVGQCENLSGSRTVALLFEHGVNMIVGMLGALKAGVTYVPLDPTYPEKRLQYMVEHSETALIVTDARSSALAARLAQIGGRVIPVLELESVAAAGDGEDLHLPIADDAQAYILYTSGSTGNPKGVVQSHENVWHFIRCYTDELGLTTADRLTLFSAFSHDAAVMDIYGALLNGATLYPLNIKDQVTLSALADWLVQEGISVYHSVPTVYRHFLQTLRGGEKFPALRLIVLGGESVLAHDVAMFKKYFTKPTVLVNLYGQSESSYNSSQFITVDGVFKKITLGKPVANTEILIINEHGEEALPLQVGEIVILSKHLALGYWKNEEKSREVFRDNPELGRVYKTGDLGRRLVDGSIEYIGRKDFQIKIRGYRVELGEIESQLLHYPGVLEVAVIAKKDGDGETYLQAFYAADGLVTVEELRAYLGTHLPGYMIPTDFALLEKLPQTPTNKVDRKALMEMEVQVKAAVELLLPANETETKLADIWKNILGREQVGVTENFFEIGGHSLKATRLIAQIWQALEVEVPLSVVFAEPTIRGLAAYIRGADRSHYAAIVPVEARAYYPVSSAQKRIYILSQLKGKNVSYNMPKVLLIEGGLDKERLAGVIERLIQRHESLRTSFEMMEDDPVQIVHAEAEFYLEEIHLPVGQRLDAEQIERLAKGFVQPFNLRRAPLLRAAVVEESGPAARTLLMFDMHHIISDGTSMQILVQEVMALYAGEELPEMRVQYKDYAVWQNQAIASGSIAQQERYWLETLCSPLPVLTMPTDLPRPAVKDFLGDKYKFYLSEVETADLLRMLQEQGVTLYMGLLAVYSVLLGGYAGQEDVIIGSPVAGRPHVDLAKIIGVFVNTLPMRTRPVGSKSFSEYLAEVKANALRAFENQDYQFEMMVEKLQVQRDFSRNALFDAMLILQNMVSGEVSDEGELKVVPYDFVNKVAKLDLTLIALESKGGITFELEYSTSLFKRTTIERMAADLLRILREVVANPGVLLAEIKLVDSVEHSREEVAVIFRQEIAVTQGLIAATANLDEFEFAF